MHVHITVCDMKSWFLAAQVSALSYGSWVSFHNQLDTKNAKALMGQCFDAGVNFFDNAEVCSR
jgi:aryl-alcohol dehydrogenase-like predicted oxidoreductase